MRNIKLSKSFRFLEKNCFFILIIGIMIGGLITGTYIFCNMNESVGKSLSFMSTSFIADHTQKNIMHSVLNGFYTSTAELFVLFILGFCAVLQPLTLAFSFVKGFGLGLMLSQIYSSAGYKGFLIIILLIIPSTLICVFALALGIQESFRMSNSLAKKAFSNKVITGARDDTVTYCKKFLILEVLIIISSAVDGLCSLLFSRILL